MSASDQAFFLFDHLEGEACEEIKYRPCEERADPAKIIEVLQELYVALQEAFFSRWQLEGETLLEFSLALMGLMTSVKQRAPSGIPNTEVLLRDQFVEHVLEGSLHRELKQFMRRQPTATLLEVRSEAIRWEREGLPRGSRGRSHSVPSVFGAQCVVQGSRQGGVGSPQASELCEMREMLKLQQGQLNQLTQRISHLQGSQPHSRTVFRGPIICRRCQQSGHIARECDGVFLSTLSLPCRPLSQVGRPTPPRSRETSTRRTAEPQFGGGSYWLRVRCRLRGSVQAHVILSSFTCEHGGVAISCLVDNRVYGVDYY